MVPAGAGLPSLSTTLKLMSSAMPGIGLLFASFASNVMVMLSTPSAVMLSLSVTTVEFLSLGAVPLITTRAGSSFTSPTVGVRTTVSLSVPAVTVTV